MFWFFKRRKNPPEGALVQEEWKESFPSIRKSRFLKEKTESYSVDFTPKGLKLKLDKKNLFAWCSYPYYRYADFHAECSFNFESPETYSSAGIMFRIGNDFNYYYFLVSNRGFFRVDCVFNSNPIHLIDWTELAVPPGKTVALGVTGWGSYYIFYADGNEIARLHDETIENGSIAFCAQNYDTAENAEIMLKKFCVNSYTNEVEKLYTEESAISDQQRLSLAKTFFKRANFIPAAVQMRTYLKKPENQNSAENMGFYSEILLNLGMFKEALEIIEKALVIDPDNINFILEKGNILYQLGRYGTLGKYLEHHEEKFAENSVYYNLRGHSSYFTGNYNEASGFYKKAAETDRQNPFYLLNTARAFEKESSLESAADYYAESCAAFFRLENYEEAENIISWFKNKKQENRKVKTVKAKILFYKNRINEAEKIFRDLIKQDPDCESGIYFLYGLILFNKGRQDKALGMIRKACEIEKDFYIYWFKLAELQYISGIDASWALKHAYDLGRDECWVNNLAGKIFLEKGNLIEADKYLYKAWSLNPSEEIIAVNYSEVLMQSGKTDESLKVLDTENPGLEMLKQKGKILAASGNVIEAEKILKKAVAEYPEDVSVKKELTKLYFEIEDFRSSWDIISSIDSSYHDSEIFNLLGNISRIEGNFREAEEYYIKSISMNNDPVVILNYAEGLCEQFDYKKAHEVMRLLDIADNNKIDKRSFDRKEMLFRRIQSMTEKVISCGKCGREWRVPVDVKISRKLKIKGELSPESPAGKCSSCGSVYCVGCASEKMDNGRLLCIECGERLKLSDDYLRHLVMEIENLN